MNKQNEGNFSSKKEASHYMQLRKRKLDGDVKYFLRKVPFDLGKEGTYFADFLVVWSDDSVSFENTNPSPIPQIESKKAMAEFIYDIKINQV